MGVVGVTPVAAAVGACASAECRAKCVERVLLLLLLACAAIIMIINEQQRDVAQRGAAPHEVCSYTRW